MKLWQVNFAINDLCKSVEDFLTIIHWRDMNESRILHELVICILGSGVKYELVIAYAEIVTESLQLIEFTTDDDGYIDFLSNILSSPAYSKIEQKQYSKYRYPIKGSQYIWHSIKNIKAKHGNIINLLNKELDASTLRRRIISLCPGIGPKQGSHFLNNINYTENVAVIDRHIIKYLEAAVSIKIKKESLSKIEYYETLEFHFQKVAKKFPHSPSVVDQAMWFIMRNLGSEGIT